MFDEIGHWTRRLPGGIAVATERLHRTRRTIPESTAEVVPSNFDELARPESDGPAGVETVSLFRESLENIRFLRPQEVAKYIPEEEDEDETPESPADTFRTPGLDSDGG